jgi:hypothetical protein
MGFQFNALNEQRKVQVTEATRFPGPVARLNEALSSPAFLKDLEYITGIPNLLADARLAGGGMHLTGPGGRLDVHVDFNFDENIKLHRRLNILVYLNPVWEPTWGGEIELWDKDVKNRGVSLLPLLNRCLIFRTDETSYHGVRPITGPPHVERRSFAAYYYTKEPPPGWSGQIHSTVFKARPDEKLRGYVLMPVQRIRDEVRQGLRRRDSGAGEHGVGLPAMVDLMDEEVRQHRAPRLAGQAAFSTVQHDDDLERVFAQSIAISHQSRIGGCLRGGEVCELGKRKLILEQREALPALLEAIEVVVVYEEDVIEGKLERWEETHPRRPELFL